MHNRRHEINIMKYVGATNGFIRLPFVLEGVLIGLIATVVAIGAQWCLYNYAIVPLLTDLSFLSDSIVTFSDMFRMLMLIFGGIGLSVGVFGSALSIRKYLKV
jgi:cell division transport system permease protein